MKKISLILAAIGCAASLSFADGIYHAEPENGHVKIFVSNGTSNGLTCTTFGSFDWTIASVTQSSVVAYFYSSGMYRYYMFNQKCEVIKSWEK